MGKSRRCFGATELVLSLPLLGRAALGDSMEPGHWLDPALRQEAVRDHPRDRPTEGGPIGTSRGLPVKRCAEFVLCTGPGRRSSGGRKQRGDCLSWIPPGPGAVSVQESKQVTKAPLLPESMSEGRTPSPYPGPPRVAQGHPDQCCLGREAACSARGSSRAAPNPTRKECHSARRALEESAAGRELRRISA